MSTKLQSGDSSVAFDSGLPTVCMQVYSYVCEPVAVCLQPRSHGRAPVAARGWHQYRPLCPLSLATLVFEMVCVSPSEFACWADQRLPGSACLCGSRAGVQVCAFTRVWGSKLKCHALPLPTEPPVQLLCSGILVGLCPALHV